MQQREYHFYVYILASRSRTLYIGFTNNIRLRISQHRNKVALIEQSNPTWEDLAADW
jgi:putative endonuclease